MTTMIALVSVMVCATGEVWSPSREIVCTDGSKPEQLELSLGNSINGNESLLIVRRDGVDVASIKGGLSEKERAALEQLAK